MKRVLYILLLISLFFIGAMIDDDIAEILKQKLFTYTHEKPSTALYLHTDKSIYAPGEYLWFKAYVLSGTVTDSKVIYVRLADKDRKIVISDQFPMHSLTGNGELILPDSLREGNYMLYAYTDRMINFSDHDIFMQPVHVIKGVTGGMVAEATVADTTKLQTGEEVNINVKVSVGNVPVNNAKGAYRLYAGEKFIKGAKLTTNSLGETQIIFTYPQLTTGQNLRVNVTFNKDDDLAELNLDLHSVENTVTLDAYAEGGHLLAGIPTNLAIKATSSSNDPVSTTVSLNSNGQEINRIITNTDGIGTVMLTPRAGNSYTLQVLGNKESKLNHFPKVETRGNSLKISHQKDKTLQAVVYNKGYKGNAFLVLRNYESVLWSKKISFTADDSLNVSIPTDQLPKDVLNLALFDKDGTLKAERLFLNNTSEKENYNLDIHTDEQVYGTRKKATVILTATDNNGNPVQADLSVSVATSGRIDIDSYKNILQAHQYRFLNIGKGTSEKNINDILLTSTWRTGGWPQVIAYKPKGELKLIDNTGGIKGTILPIGTNINITGWQLQAGSERVSITINNKGMFSIPSEALLTARGKQLQWVGGVKFREGYRINYNNEDAIFDNKIISGQVLNDPDIFNTITAVQSKTEFSKFSFNSINELGEVRIKNKVASIGDFWSANCDDYVCENEILNCELHPPGTKGNHKPEQGKTYAIIDMASLGNRHVIYRGCKNTWSPDMLKNIYTPLGFPPPNYDKESLIESQLISTVYWNPNLNTNNNGKAVFSFFTSDIKGDYRIIVQGVKTGKTEPLYGTAQFTVK